jgi:hypothetical protein
MSGFNNIFNNNQFGSGFNYPELIMTEKMQVFDQLNVQGSAYIKTLEVDTVKIDNVITQNVTVNGDATITGAIGTNGLVTTTFQATGQSSFSDNLEVGGNLYCDTGLEANSIICDTSCNVNGTLYTSEINSSAQMNIASNTKVTIYSGATTGLSSYIDMSQTTLVPYEEGVINVIAESGSININGANEVNIDSVANVNITAATFSVEATSSDFIGLVTVDGIIVPTPVPALDDTEEISPKKKQKLLTSSQFSVDLSTNATPERQTFVNISSEDCLGLMISDSGDYMSGQNFMMYKNFMSYLPVNVPTVSTTPYYFLGCPSTSPSQINQLQQSLIDYLNNAELTPSNRNCINFGSGSGTGYGSTTLGINCATNGAGDYSTNIGYAVASYANNTGNFSVNIGQLAGAGYSPHSINIGTYSGNYGGGDYNESVNIGRNSGPAGKYGICLGSGSLTNPTKGAVVLNTTGSPFTIMGPSMDGLYVTNVNSRSSGSSGMGYVSYIMPNTVSYDQDSKEFYYSTFPTPMGLVVNFNAISVPLHTPTDVQTITLPQSNKTWNVQVSIGSTVAYATGASGVVNFSLYDSSTSTMYYPNLNYSSNHQYICFTRSLVNLSGTSVVNATFTWNDQINLNASSETTFDIYLYYDSTNISVPNLSCTFTFNSL